MIYASGSTGQPRGVAVSQATLVAHYQAAARTYGVGPGNYQLQFAPINFGTIAEQLSVPLLVGVRVLLSDAGQQSVQHLADEVGRHAVTILDLPPACLQRQAEELCHADRRIAVRAYILGDGAWDTSLLTQQVVQAEAWFDVYDPTEAVITPLAWHCRTQEGGAPAIGHALGTCQACILDITLQSCVPGMIGELYIGSRCLAHGYLGHPNQTAERFAADPFSGSGEHLYRTEDLACYRVDGQVEYFGRADQRIKIRGLRIEIGEIESRLLAHPCVAEAAAMTQDGAGGPLLAAYLVGRDITWGEDLLTELGTWLAGCLPTYMQPMAWQVLSSLPLNASGKLDRKALPEVDAVARHQAGESPREGPEHLVAAVWEALLGAEGIARDERSFELGGHSPSTARVVSCLCRGLELDISLRVLSERSVLADFVTSLESQVASVAPVLQVLPRVVELSLSRA